MLNKKYMILNLLVILIISFTLSSGITYSKTFNFRIKTGPPETIDRYITDKFFEFTEEKVDYNIEQQRFLAGEIFTMEEHIEALRSGMVDFVETSPSWAHGISPLFSTFELPFLFEDAAQFHEVVVEKGGGELLEDILLEEANVRILFWGTKGARWMFLKEKINSLDDLKGLDMRSPSADVYVDMMEIIGLNPVTLPWSEIHTSLETGLVEGMEGPPTLVYDEGFHEVTNYAFPSKHLLTTSYIVVREDKFQELPEDLQEAMLEAGYETAVHMKDKIGEFVEENVNAMKEETGIEEIDEVDPSPLREKFSDYHMEWAEKHGIEEEVKTILELFN